MVVLGKKYKDSISGFTGVAVARTVFLHGCIRIGLCPAKVDKDGKILEDVWFDEPQLRDMRGKKVADQEVEDANHGPRMDAARRRDPVR